MVFSSDLMEWVLAIVFLAFATILLVRLYQADLSGLIRELDGQKASLSRFQFLVFTVAISGLYVTLSLQAGELVAVDNGTLALLGISGGGYAISKAISKAGASDDKPKDSKKT